MASTYADVNAPNPATRYMLAEFAFNHLFSVAGPGDPPNDCGGIEVPVCAHLVQASWLTLDGQEIQYPFAKEYVTSNDPTNGSGCPGATPAEAATWGEIKHQYKR
jgi:hypothetical protein